MNCSDECGCENAGDKGQGGVGLALRTPNTRAARSPEFISDRWLKVALELRGRAKTVTFFVAYVPQNATDNKYSGRPWTELKRRYLNTNSCSC